MPQANSLTPAERSLRAQIAAHDSWARTPDRPARTAPGRKAFDEKFEREVDLNNELPPAERAKRAEHARKAYFARLALKSAQARRRRSSVAAERNAAVQARIADVDGGGDSDAA